MLRIADINGGSSVGAQPTLPVAGGGKTRETKTISKGGIQYILTMEKISSGTGEDVIAAIKDAKAKAQGNFSSMSDEAKSGIGGTPFSSDSAVNNIINSNDPESAALAYLAENDFYSWVMTPKKADDAQKKADSESNKAMKEEESSVRPFGAKETKVASLTLTGNTGSGTKTIIENNSFMLTGFSFEDKERAQIIQCFDTVHMQVFGRSPMVINVTGVLVRSTEMDWYGDFMDSYEKYFRASKAIENNAMVVLLVDDTIYEGHVLSLSIRRDSTSPIGVPMAFPMIVYKKTHLGKTPSTVDSTPASPKNDEVPATETSTTPGGFIGPPLPPTTPAAEATKGFIGPTIPKNNPASPAFVGPLKPSDNLISHIVKTNTMAGGGVSVIKKVITFLGGGGHSGGGGATGSW